MSLTEQSDAYLVGAIINGDVDAVRPLIERYQRPLLAVLKRGLGASADLEDIAQETWIRVVRSASRYDPAQRFSAWLFAIAWNLMRDRWSRHRSYEEIPELSSGERSVVDRMVDDERADRIRDLVNRLPERLAQSILLRFFEDLTEKEVAAHLGIPLGTVKSRVHHGLRHLAASMNGEDL